MASRWELCVAVDPRRRPEEKVRRAKARPRLWSDAEPLRLRAADTRSSSVLEKIWVKFGFTSLKIKYFRDSKHFAHFRCS